MNVKCLNNYLQKLEYLHSKDYSRWIKVVFRKNLTPKNYTSRLEQPTLM